MTTVIVGLSAIAILTIMRIVHSRRMRRHHPKGIGHHYHAGRPMTTHPCGDTISREWTCCYCGKTIQAEYPDAKHTYTELKACKRAA